MIDCQCPDCGAEFSAEPVHGHRIVCGDSTEKSVVESLTRGRSVDLCFTSPPYAQQRLYNGVNSDWDALMQGVFEAAPLGPKAQVLVNLGLVHRDGEWLPYWEGWIAWMRSAGWRRFGWYVWDQGPGLLGDWHGRFAPSHEFIFHFNRAAVHPKKTMAAKRAGETLHPGGLRAADGTIKPKTGAGRPIQDHKIPDSVVRVMRHKAYRESGSHPAPFPVALAEAILRPFMPTDGVVYEPFCGSGTQVIAAERLGLACWAIEISPPYVDISVRRWQEFTGRAAVREADGAPFP